jgi:hypothetical protein|tara:strand:- start:809 stop:1030 length:222 start_codon:yes stop_codon:yes gene_type:complete
MDKNKKEAKLVGFKILLDKSGKLTAEMSGLPLDDVDKTFKNHPNKHLYRTLIRLSNNRIGELVEDLEKHLSAI